jgi:Fic family protein
MTWDASRIATPLAAVRHEQGRHLGKMLSLGFDLRVEAGLEILTEDVVKSWALEGEHIDPTEVRSSFARHLEIEGIDPGKPGRAGDGVVEMMRDATRESQRARTKERLFAWHASLFPTGYSGLRRITVAEWRPASADPMQVVSGSVGRSRVHFEAPTADRLDGEMRSFLAWLEGEHGIDPVLMAGLAHLRFVTIHPFEDGNGRIARAIADLCLARADQAEQRFYSLSAQIESERREYYDQLEAAQRGGLDVTGWLEWFLGFLHRAIQSSAGTLERVLEKARFWQRAGTSPMNERQRKILNRLLDGFEGKLTSSKYARIARCSPDTALRDIHELMALGLLAKNPAGGRSTSYRLGGLRN